MAVGDEFFGNVKWVFNPSASDTPAFKNRAFAGAQPVVVGSVGNDGHIVFSAGGHLELPLAGDPMFTDPYTIDFVGFWTLVNGTMRTLLHIPAGSGGVNTQLKIYLGTDNKIKVLTGGTIHDTAFTPVENGDTYEYSLVRQPSTNSTRLYVNGVAVGSAWTDATSYDFSGSSHLGGNSANGELAHFTMYDFRWTSGVARQNATYTPPGTPYPPYFVTIEGDVLDENNDPVSVEIIVIEPFGRTKQGDTYNSNSGTLGHYAVPVPYAGEWNLIFFHPKYLSAGAPLYRHKVVRVDAQLP